MFIEFVFNTPVLKSEISSFSLCADDLPQYSMFVRFASIQAATVTRFFIYLHIMRVFCLDFTKRFQAPEAGWTRVWVCEVFLRVEYLNLSQECGKFDFLSFLTTWGGWSLGKGLERPFFRGSLKAFFRESLKALFRGSL